MHGVREENLTGIDRGRKCVVGKRKNSEDLRRKKRKNPDNDSNLQVELVPVIFDFATVCPDYDIASNLGPLHFFKPTRVSSFNFITN